MKKVPITVLRSGFRMRKNHLTTSHLTNKNNLKVAVIVNDMRK